MGYPFELLVKEFRRSETSKPFKDIPECMESFGRYLSSLKISNDSATSVVLSIFRQLLQQLQQEVFRKWSSSGANLDKLGQAITDHLTQRLTEARALPPSKAFADTDAATLGAKLATEIEFAIENYYPLPKQPDHTNLLKQLAAETIFREPLSEARSGVVIAGFGDTELCPSLSWIELDGVIDGRLKWRVGGKVEVGSSDSGAQILAFAQDETAEMFLTGLLPSEEEYFANYVLTQLNNIADVAAQIVNTPQARETLQSEVQRLFTDFQKKVGERKNKSRSRVLAMVRFMPVQELIVLAEFLIEITSLRRRVTDDLETVGGAVDVAAITRSEGLVWIKRKHYFDRELNSRFFMRQDRKFGSQSGERDAQNVKRPKRGARSQPPADGVKGQFEEVVDQG